MSHHRHSCGRSCCTDTVVDLRALDWPDRSGYFYLIVRIYEQIFAGARVSTRSLRNSRPIG